MINNLRLVCPLYITMTYVRSNYIKIDSIKMERTLTLSTIPLLTLNSGGRLKIVPVFCLFRNPELNKKNSPHILQEKQIKSKACVLLVDLDTRKLE